MKSIPFILTAAVLFLFTAPVFSACDSEVLPPVPEQGGEPGGGDENDDPMQANLNLTVDGTTFSVTMEDNPTARTFASLLPLTLRMSELNGNEKYAYLDRDLPTGVARPGTIHSGDLMLYGANCLVLFYKTFSSSYSYSRIGRVDDPAGLAGALGAGDVTVTFRCE